MTTSLGQHYLEDSIASLKSYKKQADKAIAQLKDDEIFTQIDEEANSVAIIMKHLAGNMFSRWTDFLTTDGEKPNRHRDLEFVIETKNTKEEILDFWERGWQCVFDALEPLKQEDLLRKVMIRGEEHTVMQAINRQLMHYPNHIGQIILLAKHFRSTDWQTLSIPRNRSADFNAYLSKQAGVASADTRFSKVEDFVKEAPGTK